MGERGTDCGLSVKKRIQSFVSIDSRFMLQQIYQGTSHGIPAI
jgi:hypothetical protein